MIDYLWAGKPAHFYRGDDILKYNLSEVVMEYLRAAGRGRPCIVHDSEEAIAAQKVLLARLPEDVSDPAIYHRWLRDVCSEQDGESLDCMLILANAFKLFDEETISILAQVSCDDWHCMAEELVAIFEEHKTDSTSDVLFKMALSRYPGQYYSDDDNGIVARKAVWALWRMDEIEMIEQLAESDDEIAAGYARKQLRRLK
jgi:hypothetical protein